MSKIDKDLNNLLLHYGAKGMRWGYNDGEPNGKRSAGEDGTGSSPEELANKLKEARMNLEKIKAQNEKNKSEADNLANSEAFIMLKNIISGVKKTKNAAVRAETMLGNTFKSISSKQKEVGSKILKSIFGR